MVSPRHSDRHRHIRDPGCGFAAVVRFLRTTGGRTPPYGHTSGCGGSLPHVRCRALRDGARSARGPTHVSVHVPIHGALPRALREPGRRARAGADPRGRRRRVPRLDRGGRSAPHPRRAARRSRRRGRGTDARAALAARAPRGRERTARCRVARECGRSLIRAARARAGADVGGDRDPARGRRRGDGGLERARAANTRGRPCAGRASDRMDRRHAGDRRRRGGRLAAGVPHAPPPGRARLLLAVASRPADTPLAGARSSLAGLLARRDAWRWALGELLANSAWAGTLVFSGALFTEARVVARQQPESCWRPPQLSTSRGTSGRREATARARSTMLEARAAGVGVALTWAWAPSAAVTIALFGVAALRRGKNGSSTVLGFAVAGDLGREVGDPRRDHAARLPDRIARRASRSRSVGSRRSRSPSEASCSHRRSRTSACARPAAPRPLSSSRASSPAAPDPRSRRRGRG